MVTYVLARPFVMRYEGLRKTKGDYKSCLPSIPLSPLYNDSSVAFRNSGFKIKVKNIGIEIIIFLFIAVYTLPHCQLDLCFL